MPASRRARIPPAPRKTILDWIETDDGNAPRTIQPDCSAEVQALHARVLAAAGESRRERSEPLQPPPGFNLAPLG